MPGRRETLLRAARLSGAVVLAALLLGPGCQSDRCVGPEVCRMSIVLVTPDGTFRFPTIQAAIEAASDGDTVKLGNGTFTGDGNRDIDFLGKAITLRSASGDPRLCRIDCEADSANPRRGLFFHSNEGPQSVVEGITIANGDMTLGVQTPPEGGGAACYSASPTFRRCVFLNNAARYGGGLSCRLGSGPLLVGCHFSGNHAHNGGAVSWRELEQPEFKQCVFSGNSATTGGAVFCEDVEVLSFEGCDLIENLALAGGAVRYWGGSVGFTSCRFIRNIAGSESWSGSGGAVSLAGCAAAFGFCEFEENAALRGSGGGIRSETTYLTLYECTFSGNTAGGGGGVSGDGQRPMEVIRCVFGRNSAGHGGAMRLFGRRSPSEIRDCSFHQNESTGSGGAVSLWESAVRFENCSFAENRAASARGGAVFYQEAFPAFERCLFVGNESEVGGAMCFERSYPIITSCTFAYNSCTDHGGTLCSTDSSEAACEKCILAFSVHGEAVYCEDEASAPAFTCSDIYGNAGGDWTWPLSEQLGREGNICKDPKFCARQFPLTYYQLNDNSPCGPDSSSCGLMGARPVGCR